MKSNPQDFSGQSLAMAGSGRSLSDDAASGPNEPWRLPLGRCGATVHPFGGGYGAPITMVSLWCNYGEICPRIITTGTAPPSGFAVCSIYVQVDFHPKRHRPIGGNRCMSVVNMNASLMDIHWFRGIVTIT